MVKTKYETENVVTVLLLLIKTYLKVFLLLEI